MHAAISDYLLDVVQNSLEAAATKVNIEIIENSESLQVTVQDNGQGMTPETLRNAIDPFFSSGEKHRRKQGLGLAFLAQAVEATTGKFSLKSTLGQGAIVVFEFKTKHIDCPPVGDLVGTILSALIFPGDYELALNRKKENLEYKISRKELLEQLGDLETAESISLAKQYLMDLENV